MEGGVVLFVFLAQSLICGINLDGFGEGLLGLLKLFLPCLCLGLPVECLHILWVYF